MANNKYTPTDVKDLDATDIGTVVRFYQWSATRESATVVTAELRQIVHYGDHTTLLVGTGAAIEESFQHGEIVSLDPPRDYSDVPELRQAMGDFHGIGSADLL